MIGKAMRRLAKRCDEVTDRGLNAGSDDPCSAFIRCRVIMGLVPLLFCGVFTLCASARADDAPAEPLRLRMDVGFSHWYADDLRSSVDLTHPTVGLGFRPGLELLELRFRYDLSQVVAPAGGTAESFDGDYIHFVSGGLAVCKTFYLPRQHLNVLAGLNAVLPILGGEVSVGGSLGIGIEYLFTPRPESAFAIGVFMEARNQYYKLNLPNGEQTDTQCDLVLDLGVVATLW